MEKNKIYECGSVVVVVVAIICITLLLILPNHEQSYNAGYKDGYSDGDLLLSQNSAMCEIEFDGKVSGFLKGLLNVTKNLPANSTLELTEADGNLQLSGKVKFPCGRMEKYLVEELLPFYMGK